ncbi:MAG: IS3 family transposase [Collinsella sp.]|nr:IS3 family transposase [Collinsella sp.]
MYSQSARKKALEVLALTGDFEKSARMSGISGRTLRRWAANAAGPQQRTCGAKFEPYGDEVRGKAMEMARKGASCRGIAEALGIGSPDAVRYWLKGGGTKGARMGGRARTPEGDEPAYAGFEGGLEERIRQLELENDILRGAVDLLKAGSLGSMSNMGKTVLIDKLRLESDRPLRELTDSLRISKSSYEYCRAKLRAKDRHAQLRIDIRRIFDGAGGTRGYRYVHNELREGGVVVSEKVVRGLMAEEGCKVAYLKRKRRYSSYKGEISDAPPQPGEAQLPRGRAERAVAHRHHRVQAAQRGEGVPQPGHRLLRRPRRGMADRKAPERGARQRLPGGRVRDALPGPAPGLPLGQGMPLQMARLDRHMRGKRPGPVHVEEGLQPGQLGLRRLLRPPQEH